MNLSTRSLILALLVVASGLFHSLSADGSAISTTRNSRELQTTCSSFTTAASLVNAINGATTQPLAKNRIITVCQGSIQAYNGTELNLVNPVTVHCQTPLACSITPDTSYQGHFLYVSAGNLTLDGFDISGFAGFDLNGTTFGGAFFQGSGSKLTILNSNLHNNRADYGGAFHVYKASLTLKNSIFSSNVAVNTGGVVNAYQSPVTVSNSTFNSNSGSKFGGAFFAQESNVAIINSALGSNDGGIGGGGLYSYISTISIGSTSFIANKAQYGGAFHLNGNSNATIQGTTFQGNTASINGGALYGYAATLGSGGTISINNGCRFSGNIASVDGGAVYLYNAGFNFVTTTVFKTNTAGRACNNIFYAAPQLACGP